MAPTPRQRGSHSVRPQSTATNELPPYQPLQHPLNPDAIHALDTLPMKHDLSSLKEQIKKSHQMMNEATADLIQNLTNRQSTVQKRKEARANKDPTASGPVTGEDEASELQRKVNDMAKKLEAKTRLVIDVQAKVVGGEVQRQELATIVASGNGRVDVSSTQSTLGASQFRAGRESSDGENEDEEEEPQPRNQSGAGIVNPLKRKTEDFDKAYDALSMSERYSKHNDYIGFKKFVHDAQYPGEEKPPLPHASTWFDGETANAVSGTQVTGTASEDEIEAVAERVSINCPLTLLPMKTPVTSSKCPHSFEQEAILEMISLSSLQVGGSGRRGAQDGTKAIKCPVCQIVLTAADLKPDPALKRRIEGIQDQQRREQEEEEDDDEDDGPRPEEIDSGDDLASSRRSNARNIKSERPSVVPSTQVNHARHEESE